MDEPGKPFRRHSRGDGLSSPSVELVLAIVFRYQHISGSIKMKPKIDQTSFGSITIEGKAFEYDVLIRMNGEIEKRKKKLSKAIYGTSHVLSLDEAKYVYEKGTKRLIIGSGQDGNVELSNEAAEYFESKHCKVDLWPTPKAIGAWNKAEGDVIGLFHVTC
jgi:hypothetical protein